MMKFFGGLVLGALVALAASFLMMGSNAPQAAAVPDEPVVADVSEAVNTPTSTDAELPAYMVVLGNLKDREAFMEGYAMKLGPIYEKYDGQYIAIGAGLEVLEGDLAYESFVIGKWPSMEAARAFWESPEYEVLKQARIEGDWGDFDVLLIPGLKTPVRSSPALETTADAP